MPFELSKQEKGKETEKLTRKRIPIIKVMGVGGAGNNAVNRMAKTGLKNVVLIAVNTDVQVLEETDADLKIQIGERRTRGLGAGEIQRLAKKPHSRVWTR